MGTQWMASSLTLDQHESSDYHLDTTHSPLGDVPLVSGGCVAQEDNPDRHQMRPRRERVARPNREDNLIRRSNG
jgi:hypothetical protein